MFKLRIHVSVMYIVIMIRQYTVIDSRCVFHYLLMHSSFNYGSWSFSIMVPSKTCPV